MSLLFSLARLAAEHEADIAIEYMEREVYPVTRDLWDELQADTDSSWHPSDSGLSEGSSLAGSGSVHTSEGHSDEEASSDAASDSSTEFLGGLDVCINDLEADAIKIEITVETDEDTRAAHMWACTWFSLVCGELRLSHDVEMGEDFGTVFVKVDPEEIYEICYLMHDIDEGHLEGLQYRASMRRLFYAFVDGVRASLREAEARRERAGRVIARRLIERGLRPGGVLARRAQRDYERAAAERAGTKSKEGKV